MTMGLWMSNNIIGKLYKWLPYFGLICLLVIVYIANVHRVEKKVRKINKTHKEIEELHREYISIKQRSMYNGTLYQVTKDLEGVDMNRDVRIPVKIDRVDAKP